jgi:hypothetical protein
MGEVWKRKIGITATAPVAINGDILTQTVKVVEDIVAITAIITFGYPIKLIRITQQIKQ